MVSYSIAGCPLTASHHLNSQIAASLHYPRVYWAHQKFRIPNTLWTNQTVVDQTKRISYILVFPRIYYYGCVFRILYPQGKTDSSVCLFVRPSPGSISGTMIDIRLKQKEKSNHSRLCRIQDTKQTANIHANDVVFLLPLS